MSDKFELLKECPFCDGEQPPSVVDLGEEKTFRWMVECMWCGARTNKHTSREHAIEAWNLRPREDGLERELSLAEHDAEKLAERFNKDDEICIFCDYPTSNHTEDCAYANYHDRIHRFFKGNIWEKK